MIEVVKENPCKYCGIKGLYENCSEKCVQYRKYFQYKQGREDAIEEVISKCDKEYQSFSDDTVCKIWLSDLEELKERKNS